MATSNLTSCGALIYCTSTKRYLFLLRNNSKAPSSWGIVGGKIESDETIYEGLHREIKEELGGEIKDGKIIPLEKYTSDHNRFVYHTFLIKVEEEFIPVLNDEHRGYAWTFLDDCPKPRHPGLDKTLKIHSIKEKILVHEQITD
jgi:8-oxo-dGTP pyrophosphatase MutT (NUDIX family)